jgi:hypothetical protein
MISLFLFSAICLAPQVLHERGTSILRYDPVITSVETAMSYEPGLVSIRGEHFDFVNRVMIDGHDVPIARISGNEIWIKPDRMYPGFAPLELRDPRTSIKGAIEFAPSLYAAWYGDALRIRVNPLEPGLIWVNWSPRTLVTNLPGIYYPQMLDMSVPKAGMLGQASSMAGEAVVFTAPIPAQIGLLDLRRIINLQAVCMLGEEQFLCHTNIVTVAPHGIYEGKLPGQ